MSLASRIAAKATLGARGRAFAEIAHERLSARQRGLACAKDDEARPSKSARGAAAPTPSRHAGEAQALVGGAPEMKTRRPKPGNRKEP